RGRHRPLHYLEIIACELRASSNIFGRQHDGVGDDWLDRLDCRGRLAGGDHRRGRGRFAGDAIRSEEHTSELQSRENLVCRRLHEPAAAERYTFSLADALPISRATQATALP